MARKKKSGSANQSAVQSYWFVVTFPRERRNSEIHEVFAASEVRAKALLSDRYLRESPRIERFQRKQVK